jgi:hypothetical protein
VLSSKLHVFLIVQDLMQNPGKRSDDKGLPTMSGVDWVDNPEFDAEIAPFKLVPGS